MAVQRDLGVVKQGGAAAGRLTGISHLAFITHDMEASVRFYRDVLGLKVVRTNPPTDTLRYVRESYDRDDSANLTFERQYFFELPNREIFTLYEVPNPDDQFDASIVPHLWPELPARVRAGARPQKADHLAFDVPNRDELVWFKERLEAYGIPVSKIIERKLDPSHAKFVSRSTSTIPAATRWRSRRSIGTIRSGRVMTCRTGTETIIPCHRCIRR